MNSIPMAVMIKAQPPRLRENLITATADKASQDICKSFIEQTVETSRN